MHTHHGSGQMFIVNGLNVLLFLTFWRLLAVVVHGSRIAARYPYIAALSRAAYFQAG